MANSTFDLSFGRNIRMSLLNICLFIKQYPKYNHNGLRIHHFLRFGWNGWKLLIMTIISGKKVITFQKSGYRYPISLRNHTSDVLTYYQVIWRDEYNVDFEFEPQIIFDLGANIGLAAIYFKNRFPVSKIFCVEPEDSNYELLRTNMERYNDVFCIKSGIWNKSTNLVIDNPSAKKYEFTVREVSYSNAFTIKARSIKDIMEEYGIEKIDIVKIDIEGSEKELFFDNYDYWMPRTRVIIIELHDRIRRGSSASFFKALINYNFSIKQQGEYLYCFLD